MPEASLYGTKRGLVARGHDKREGIDYDEVFAPVARIEAIRLFLAFASYMGFLVYQLDVKSAFLYGEIEEEVYVTQPKGFEDPYFPKHVYRVVKALYGLHQAPRAWYARLSTFLLQFTFKKRTATTPYEAAKTKLKDETDPPVNVHLYRSMIGSLMYLTASRPDIMLPCKKYGTIVATSSTEASMFCMLADVLKFFGFGTRVDYGRYGVLWGYNFLVICNVVNTVLVVHYPADRVVIFHAGRFGSGCTTGSAVVIFPVEIGFSDGVLGSAGCLFLLSTMGIFWLLDGTLSAAIVTWFSAGSIPSCDKSPMAALQHKDDHNRIAYLGRERGSEDLQFSSGYWDHSPLIATIDGREVVVTESLIRAQLQLDDANGIFDMQIDEIFAGMGAIGPMAGTLENFQVPLPQPLFAYRLIKWLLGPKSAACEEIPLTPPMLAIAAAGDAADEQNVAANEAAGSTAEAHPAPHSPPFSPVRNFKTGEEP
ncbi:putative ribonuclease H-like domain-containing protein [Tanacetum coccineum]|uniref:Ribonuclease H-like domain-containing protein n=1 Tax=Tanacetum coccineum TaxID=301880 RepID=A0ABQ5G572_9ASTR